MLARLQLFGFNELWNPILIVITVVLAIAYLVITGPMRHRFTDAGPVPIYKKVLFLFGLLLFYITLGPLNLIGHLMFSAHMTKQALLYLVMPPFIFLGSPEWFYKPFLKVEPLKKVVRVLTHPFASVAFFNVLFSLYHLPIVLDFIMTNYALYNLYHDILLISAFMMWWPFFCPIPELNRVSELKKLALIFANSVLLTPACALIIFAGEPMYATYTDPVVWSQALSLCLPFSSTLDVSGFGGPQLFALFPPLQDQQLGGVIMKIMQEIVNGTVLGIIFFQWIRSERARENKLASDNRMVISPATGQNEV
ncbi:MAG: cytochrome c oxidase assembly factor CtaG [Bacillaceae bacterium]|nr:cytochrome c oxidase assembly factor CtaG [Bacillaceae bacterium]